uniref:Uncharacterized protein n=1 Tax=Sphaerodactylus townsendi TaxID=933632 RepID=A0ACB8F7P2_9SAUR
MAPPKAPKKVAGEGKAQETGEAVATHEEEPLRTQTTSLEFASENVKARIAFGAEIQLAGLQAEREKEREAEQARMPREKEMFRLRAGLPNRPPAAGAEFTSGDTKRFPKYQKGDNVEAHLASFERTCQDLGVPEQKRMSTLRPLLWGVFSEDYADLKTKRFPIIISSERGWVEGSKVKTFEELKQLVSLEQSCRLVPHQKDKKIQTVAGVATLLDELGGDFEGGHLPIPYKKPREWHPKEKAGSPSAEPARRDSPTFRSMKGVICYHYQEEGHIKPKCPELTTPKRSPSPPKTVKVVKQAEKPEDSSTPTDGAAHVLRVWKVEEDTSRDFRVQVVTANREAATGFRDPGAEEVTLIQRKLIKPDQPMPKKTVISH